jgi:NAD(P)-dependent dehydrogenase (short-subunit alcohol dehydrogenase family)
MQRLTDQVAIVTGGAQGIGGATARRLAEEGAKVLVVDIDVETAWANVENIRAAGNVALAHQADMANHGEIKAAIERAVGEWGRLDIVVNNAFNVLTAGSGGATEVSEEVWDQGMAVMVKSIFLGAKYAVPEMQKIGGGKMVNMSSVHGLLTAPGFLVYETAKAAVIGITRQMATEFGPTGIRVNAVLPGHMVTERLQAMWDENPSGLRFFEDQYPLRKVGRAVDIANGVVFLCSEEASFITGHSLVIDGGLSIQLQENFGVRQAHYLRENPETQLPY